MMRFRVLVLLAAVAVVSPVAVASEVGPGGTWDGVSFGTLFTPPLADGEQYSAPIDYHVQGSYGNWIGAYFGINYDPTEVNFVGVTAAPGYMASMNAAGTAATIWNPGGATSMPPSTSVFPLANVTFDAKNTTPANNGDVDITFDGPGAFNIYGCTPWGSWSTYMAPSNMLYVGLTGGGQPMTQHQWAPGVAMGAGTWIHATISVPVYLEPGMYWGRMTDLTAQGGIGVEHVPEPASAVLLLGGIGTLIVARRRQRA